MSTNYLPTRESKLANWTNNFGAIITAAPTTVGLTAAQATAYNTLNAAWIASYTAATDPSTRTAGTVALKNQKKAEIIGLSRQYARIVQATPSVGDQQKIDLGLHVHDGEPSPSSAPAFAPGLAVLSVFNRTARVRLTDLQNPTRRGKPDGVAGAAVYSYVGEEPPADLSAWKAEGNTSRTSIDVTFPNDVAPGAKVFLTACWFGPRFQNGPTCPPISTHLPGGAAQAA